MTHKTLRELWRTDRTAAIEIIDAIDRGDQVEHYAYHGDGIGLTWGPKKSGRFVLDSVYRLAPRDPIIDWSQIGADIVAVALDEYGKWRMCTEMPSFTDRGELRKGGFRYPATLWPTAFTPGVGLEGTTRVWLRPKEGE